jgi:hypothetical protein
LTHLRRSANNGAIAGAPSPQMSEMRLMIVDDHEIVREGLMATLASV